MGNLSCCKCLSKNFGFVSSDPKFSQLNPNSSDSSDFIKEKTKEEAQ